MLERRKFAYVAQLQRLPDGAVEEYPVEVYWDPAREGAAELVAQTAAAEASIFRGGRIVNGEREFRYAGLTAVLQT